MLVELAGLLATLLVLLSRPQSGRAVELAVDLTAVRRYAAMRNLDPGQVLDAFREAGATTALVGEKTLYDLLTQGQAGYPAAYPIRLQAMDGGELEAMAAAGLVVPLPPGTVRPQDTYLFVRDNPDLAAWLEAALQGRLGAERVRRVKTPGDPDLTVLAVRAGPLPVRSPRSSPLLLMPLGHLPADIDLVRRHGLAVAYGVGDPVPSLGRMPLRVPDPTGAVALAHGRPVYVEGTEVPGHPGREQEFGLALVRKGAALALPTDVALPAGPGPLPAVSSEGPAGASALAATPGLAIVRAHRTRAAEGLADWLRLASEDGVRFFVFGLWPGQPPKAQELERQVGLVAAFRAALGGIGLYPGLATPVPRTAPLWLVAVAAAGVGASAVHLVLRFWTPGPGATPGTYLVTLAASLGAVGACAWVWVAGSWQAREIVAGLPLWTWPSLGVMAAASVGLDEQVLTAATVARQGSKGFDPGPVRDRVLLGRMLLRLIPYAVAGALAARALGGALPLPREPGPGPVVIPATVFLIHWAWLRGPRLVRDLAVAGERTVRVGHLLILGAVLAGLAAGMLGALRPAPGFATLSGAEDAPPPTAPGWLAPGFEVPPAEKRPGFTRVLEVARTLAPRPLEGLVAYPALGAAAWLLRRGRVRAGLWALAVAGLGPGLLAAAYANPWASLWRETVRSVLELAVGGLLAVWIQGALGRRWVPGLMRVAVS